MSEITPEVIELAALAAGKNVAVLPVGRDQFQALDVGAHAIWRPHTDMAEAARLADRYRMYVDARGTAVQAKLYAGDQWTRVEREGNPNAWCEAVTLCLAAEGRRMQAAAS